MSDSEKYGPTETTGHVDDEPAHACKTVNNDRRAFLSVIVRMDPGRVQTVPVKPT